MYRKNTESESDIHNNDLLCKINPKCQNTFELLYICGKCSKYFKIFHFLFCNIYNLQNSYFVPFVTFGFGVILVIYIYVHVYSWLRVIMIASNRGCAQSWSQAVSVAHNLGCKQSWLRAILVEHVTTCIDINPPSLPPQTYTCKRPTRVI